jgi:hypothetical protein
MTAAKSKQHERTVIRVTPGHKTKGDNRKNLPECSTDFASTRCGEAPSLLRRQSDQAITGALLTPAVPNTRR